MFDEHATKVAQRMLSEIQKEKKKIEKKKRKKRGGGNGGNKKRANTESKEWICQTCTLINDANAWRCEVCGDGKPRHAALMARGKMRSSGGGGGGEGDGDGDGDRDGDGDNKKKRKKKKKKKKNKSKKKTKQKTTQMSSTPKSPPVSRHEKKEWICSACTYVNEADVLSCSVCQRRRSAQNAVGRIQQQSSDDDDGLAERDSTTNLRESG